METACGKPADAGRACLLNPADGGRCSDPKVYFGVSARMINRAASETGGL